MMLLQQNGFNLHHYQKLATTKVRLFLNLFLLGKKCDLFFASHKEIYFGAK